MHSVRGPVICIHLRHEIWLHFLLAKAPDGCSQTKSFHQIGAFCSSYVCLCFNYVSTIEALPRQCDVRYCTCRLFNNVYTKRRKICFLVDNRLYVLIIKYYSFLCCLFRSMSFLGILGTAPKNFH